MAGVRLGLVGYGAWGACHAQVIRETPGCDLAAVCAHSADSRAELASFVRAIRERAALPIASEEARRAVALCLAAQQSLESGDVVRVEQSLATL